MVGAGRAARVLGAAFVLGTGACSLGVENDGGFGSATIASEGSQSGQASQGTDDAAATGSDDDASVSGASDPSSPSDPSGASNTADPSGSDDTDPTAGGEVCNGLDDDGDGAVDEDVPDVACGIGACQVMAAGCEGGVPAQCFPGAPGAESCNGVDDDCDGSSDEALVQPCATACGSGSQTCSAAAWSTCDAPAPQAESCDVDDDDCNGAVDDGVPGCRIGVHRWYHPVSGEHFYSTDPNEGNCCGFQLEVLDFFQLYAGSHPGLTGFYRCYGANGFHHYTTDPACEGLPGNEGIIGYIGTSDLPGSTELYRSYYGLTGDHFFTTSFAEHTAAVGGGALDEGVVGYVW